MKMTKFIKGVSLLLTLLCLLTTDQMESVEAKRGSPTPKPAYRPPSTPKKTTTTTTTTTTKRRISGGSTYVAPVRHRVVIPPRYEYINGNRVVVAGYGVYGYPPAQPATAGDIVVGCCIIACCLPLLCCVAIFGKRSDGDDVYVDDGDVYVEETVVTTTTTVEHH